MIDLIQGDFKDVLAQLEPTEMIFADPPDNIKLDYDGYDDKVSKDAYADLLWEIIASGTGVTDVLWISYNAIHTHLMGHLIYRFLEGAEEWEVKHCVQIFTFGQHNQHDLGNNHRPLVRLMRKGTPLYPDAIRVPSWRQLNGDKRADPRGRVPGDIFDFPRVTGNSKQRRKWHKTQLHEELYERCIRLTCSPDARPCDLFAGTGTMARACAKTGHDCTLIDISETYCNKIAEEHGLVPVGEGRWQST